MFTVFLSRFMKKTVIFSSFNNLSKRSALHANPRSDKNVSFKEKSNTKLDIFLFLSEHRFFITTQYLADHFHMSESNFLLYIKELEQDFERLNLTELHIDKQKPFLKLNFEGIDPAYCYYRLFGRYCKESVSYEILTSLFSCQTNSIISLSQQTNYSASYLYTKMKKSMHF